ncbi:hypothetical protein BDV29DRAFT_161693 [Aspergillus leporis]|uniref:Uncharacterized protein n=1 Tax=Aspergillus leporis TaxID=41062 RepID=A0A5N5WQ22_9EURO|nr:hypothetical protein BDV29DRAFT_161693 [Aspergillus leporis]
MTLSRALLLEVHLGGMASDCVIVHCPEVILATGVILIELQQGADGNLSGRGDAAAQSRKQNEILSRGPYQATGFEGLVRDVDAHDSGPQDARSCPAMAVE